MRRGLRKPFYDLLRKKKTRATEVECKKGEKPPDKCCCDGERLILLLEEFVPAYAAMLKNLETAEEDKVYRTYTTREHAHNVMRWYLNTYGGFVSRQWNAMILLMLCTRAVAWRIARAQGSPRHTATIAGRLVADNRGLLEEMYKHGMTCGHCGGKDLILSQPPRDVETLLTIAAIALADDPLRKFITGQQLERKPDYADLAKDLDFETGADITIERESGKISLARAVEIIRNMAESVPKDLRKRYGPREIYAILMAVFQIEMGCYDLETIKKETVATDKFSLGNTYMDYRPSLYSFLWEEGKDKWRGASTPEFGFGEKPDKLFKTLLVLVGGPAETPADPTPPSVEVREGSRDLGFAAELPRALPRARLADQAYQLKPPGMDPINDRQYQVLRNFVKYDAEVPGSANYRNPATHLRCKLQNFLGKQDFDAFIEALSDSPCADEVLHFVCRKLDERYHFPTERAGSPQELARKILAYLWVAPITITFPLDNWFLAADAASANYPAKNWDEYKHTFQLPTTQKPVDLGAITGSTADQLETIRVPPPSAAHAAPAMAAVADDPTILVLSREPERRRLMALAEGYQTGPRRLTPKAQGLLDSYNRDFKALSPERQEWVKQTYDRRGEGLRTYTTQADYACSRIDNYNRWRIDKDLRAAGFMDLSPADFPAYGALNFDVELTGGWYGLGSPDGGLSERVPLGGYRYYGSAHFVLNSKVVVRRCTYELRHYYQPCRKSFLLLLADILTKPLEQLGPVNYGIDTLVGHAIGSSRLYAKNGHMTAYSEVQVYGTVRFGADKEVNRILLPDRLDRRDYDEIVNRRLTDAAYERLEKRYNRGWQEFEEGPVKDAMNVAEAKAAAVVKAEAEKVQEHTTEKKKVDKKKSMLWPGVTMEAYERRVKMAAIAKELGIEYFARSIGKIGPQCTANVLDFCTARGVEPIFIDLVAERPPRQIVADGTRPLPPPGGGPMPDETKRTAMWWLYLDT